MRRFAGFTEILICTLTWGSISPIVSQLDVRPSLIVLFRVVVGAVVVLLAAVVWGKTEQLRPRGNVPLLAGSGIVLAVHWAMLFETYKRLDVASAVALVFVGPVISAAVGPRFLGGRLRTRTLVPVALAFGGLAAITVPEIERLDPVGVVFGLLSALSFSVLLVLGKHLARTERPLTLAVWQLSVASLPMLFVLQGGTAGIRDAWPVLVMLGAFHTGVMGLLLFRAMAALEPHQLGTMFYVEPAAAVVYAWMFIGQIPTAWTALGFALIVVAGIAIVFEQATPMVSPVASPETVAAPTDESST